MYYLSDSGSDSDREEKVQEKRRLALINKTAKKYEGNTIFCSPTSPSDNDFIRYEFDNDLTHLHEYNSFFQGKSTQMTFFSDPVKNTYKLGGEQKQIPQIKQAEKQIAKFNLDNLRATGNLIVEFPQTAVGYIQVQFSNGKVQRGSGSLIGPNHVLSLARNVIDSSKPDNKIVNIHFWPGLKGKNLSFKEVKVARVVLLPKSQKPISPQNKEDQNFTVLILEEPLGLSTGWFGLLNPENLDTIARNFEVHGYPQTDDEDLQSCLNGKVLKTAPNKDTHFEYTPIQCGGMLGGPVSISRQVSPELCEHYILGVHIEGGSGLRLNKEKFDEVRNILELFFLKSSLDEENFFVTAVQKYKDYIISFENSIGITPELFNSCLHSMRFANNLQSLTITTKLDHEIATPLFGDESLVLIKDSLTVMRHLKFLKLEITSASRVTGQGLQTLSDSLQQMREVTHFSISLIQSKQISSKQLAIFLASISRLAKLSVLSVSLVNIELADDEALQSLGALLYNLGNNLNQLKLHFQGLPKTSEQGFYQFLNNLKELKALTRLNLTLFGFVFSDGIKKEVKSHFKNLPQLVVQ